MEISEQMQEAINVHNALNEHIRYAGRTRSFAGGRLVHYAAQRYRHICLSHFHTIPKSTLLPMLGFDVATRRLTENGMLLSLRLSCPRPDPHSKD